MKCFYHEEREAVATCQRCGKGLCKECASKYTPCLCDDCFDAIQHEKRRERQSAEDRQRQKYINALADTRSEFLKTCILGIITGVIGWLLIQASESSSRPPYIFAILVFFSIPFGWKFLTFLQSKIPLSIIGTLWFWVAWLVVKVLLCMLVGIPAFIYQLFKTFFVQSEIKHTQKRKRYR